MEKETRLQSTDIVSLGSECCIIRRTYLIGKASTLTQDMITYTKNRRIDFVTRVDWHERRRLLKVCFDSGIEAAQVRCEVQYGQLLRNTHKNLPQDRAMFEICAHKWISVEEAGSGLALLNDCKYGHDVSGGNIRLTLLRSPMAPDTEADQGRHAFTYSLFPFEGSFAQSGVVRAAYELNAPVSWECGPGGKEEQEAPPDGEPAPVTDPSGWAENTAAKTPPAETELSGYSLLSIDNPAVVLECLKVPELPFGLTKKKKDRALVLRLYESFGGHSRATIHFNSVGGNVPGKQISGAWETDMLERQQTNLHHAGNEICLEFRPFEIKTVLVEFWGNP